MLMTGATLFSTIHFGQKHAVDLTGGDLLPGPLLGRGFDRPSGWSELMERQDGRKDRSRQELRFRESLESRRAMAGIES